MPRPTLSTNLKKMLTMNVLLTQHTEEDLFNHFEYMMTGFDEKFDYYHSKLEDEVMKLSNPNNNPFSRFNFRKHYNKELSPQFKHRENPFYWLGVRYDDVDNYMNTSNEYSKLWYVKIDLILCDREFEWTFNIDKGGKMSEWYNKLDKLNILKENEKLIKYYELKQFDDAEKLWRETDKEWLEQQKKLEIHRRHHPLEYWTELFKDEGAVRFHRGKIPDDGLERDDCSYCIKAIQRREEERLQREREEEEERIAKELERKQRQEKEERERLEDIERRKNMVLKTYECETCAYKTNNKYSYDSHCLSTEHKHKVKAEMLFCKCCGIQCRSQIEYDSHIASNKHKKNAGEIERVKEYHCEKCNYTTTLKQNFDKHIHSKKHLEKMEVVVPVLDTDKGTLE